MTWTHQQLCNAKRDELETALRAGVAPSFDILKGAEFRGYNTIALTDVLRIRKFKKGFGELEQNGALHGYNVKVQQNAYDQPWTPKLKGGQPLHHGFYDTYRVRPGEIDNLYPHALMLNYDCGRNPRFDPSQFLRDYLVQVSPDDPDLLLGKAYLAFGPKRVPVSYFVLAR